MFLIVAAVLIVAVLAFTFFIRSKDLPPPEPEPPTKHLDARKAQIYENLRDLQFEYRVGKLSDADYQRTKADLQTELAGVLAQIEGAGAAKAEVVATDPKQCVHCGAKFDKALKFCGECGKAMKA